MRGRSEVVLQFSTPPAELVASENMVVGPLAPHAFSWISFFVHGAVGW